MTNRALQNRNTLQGTNTKDIPFQGTFEDDFPFPQVGNMLVPCKLFCVFGGVPTNIILRSIVSQSAFLCKSPARSESREKNEMTPTHKNGEIIWQFFVTFLWWLSDPFNVNG